MTTTKSTMVQTTILILLAAAAVVTADKDGQYFTSGTRNPNTNDRMYWRDAQDVIDDIASFDALYVQFHSCA
jgi:hypothetical protein